MYLLEVYLPGQTTPTDHATVDKASDVLMMIPALLKAHDGCERIEVRLANTLLFSVDCAGNRISQ